LEAGDDPPLPRHGTTCRTKGGAQFGRVMGVIVKVGSLLGISHQDLLTGIASFTGTLRRFQLVGRVADVSVFDDYAHHPTELRATLVLVTNSQQGTDAVGGCRIREVVATGHLELQASLGRAMNESRRSRRPIQVKIVVTNADDPGAAELACRLESTGTVRVVTYGESEQAEDAVGGCRIREIVATSHLELQASLGRAINESRRSRRPI
jgi:UDP-N-acetylmuramyl tripeptide synthase